MSDKQTTTVRLEKRLVPEHSTCYVGPAFVTLLGGHEFIVIAKDGHSLRFAWSLLGAEQELDQKACRTFAAFEYEATK